MQHVHSLKGIGPLFVNTIGNQLGFQLSEAQSYLPKDSDCHKTWQLLDIIHVAISLELVHPNKKEALESKTYPTCDHYWEQCEQLLDPNYVYLQHMIMTYLHTLLMSR